MEIAAAASPPVEAHADAFFLLPSGSTSPACGAARTNDFATQQQLTAVAGGACAGAWRTAMETRANLKLLCDSFRHGCNFQLLCCVLLRGCGTVR
jgi:hypothetical protein